MSDYHPDQIDQMSVDELRAELRSFITAGWRSCIDHLIKPEHNCPICRIEELKVYERCCTTLTVAMDKWGWQHCADGDDMVEQIQSILDEREEIGKQIMVLQQTLSEVAHAQQCGAQWYTKGASGLFTQVSMWVRRGQAAIDEINKLMEKENDLQGK